MPSLFERVRRFSAQHRLWTPATRVVAAVSGGSDSIALLFLLRELAERHEVVLAGLAHLNHRQRGRGADEDAEACRSLATRLGLPSVIGDVDVPARASRERVSLEVAGRRARHGFLADAMTSMGADRVALAHTRDDQAETVLMHLVRGAGPTGLAGMAPARGHLIRPLLTATRQELRDFLSARRERWSEDPTNADRANPRNRMRHEVLPSLRLHFNPRLDTALCRTAEILRVDTTYLDGLAAEAAARILVCAPGRVVVNASDFADLPPSLARRVARTALETAQPGRSYGLEEADALRAAAMGVPMAELCGTRVTLLGGSLILDGRQPRKAVRPIVPISQSGLDLAVPGSVHDPDGGWTLTADGPMPLLAPGPRGPDKVMVDAGTIAAALRVRHRHPGDRVQPLGMAGHKKVQDILVDRKVPRDDRDRVPIVTGADGRIVWVAGHALAHPFRVTARTAAVIILTLRRR